MIGLVARDFFENDTGPEYIGTRRQQMGDGGVVLQIMDASGAVVIVSDGGWKSLVAHTAPLDGSCAQSQDPVAGESACPFEVTEEPDGWDAPGFDASDWPRATAHSARDVSPKDGYDRVNWAETAEFIWGPYLLRDNVVLCRGVVRC